MKRLVFAILRFTALGMLLFQAACGTLYSVGPLALVESPEVSQSDSRHVSVYFRVEPAVRFHLVDDASKRPLNVSNPTGLLDTALFTGGLNLSVKNGWEFGLAGDPIGFSYGTLNARFYAKNQFIGEPYNISKEPTHLMAAFGHLDGSYLNISGNQNGPFGPGGYPWAASSQFEGGDIGFSYGYRPNQHSLLYLGAAAQVFNVGGYVHQSAGTRGDSPESDYTLPERSGASQTLAGGYEFGVKNRIAFIFSQSHVTWNGLHDDVSFLGFVIGAHDFSKIASPILPVR